MVLALLMRIALFAAVISLSTAAIVPNMNRGPRGTRAYGIANMPGHNITLSERSNGRYVDVYTPIISSLYSQVKWGSHYVPFPAGALANNR